jgi:hypothetical protein
MSQEDKELQIEYSFEKASEQLDAFARQTSSTSLLDALEIIHSTAQNLVKSHPAHLNHVDALLMKFKRRFKPSRLVAELVAQHTAVGLGREFKPSECMRLTVRRPD